MKRFRRDNRAQLDNAVALVVGIVVAVAVGIAVTVDQVNSATALENETLNYTATALTDTVAGPVAEWNSLANDTTTLTENTHYRVYPANDTVQLLPAATDTANCGNSTNCDYYGTYYTTGATSRTVLNVLPVLFAAVILAGLAAAYVIRR